jgi:hypothetical protein
MGNGSTLGIGGSVEGITHAEAGGKTGGTVVAGTAGAPASAATVALGRGGAVPGVPGNGGATVPPPGKNGATVGPAEGIAPLLDAGSLGGAAVGDVVAVTVGAGSAPSDGR